MTPKQGDFGADLILFKEARKALSRQNAIKEK
jgi:HJR/Mrr/RecB family endonuclease